MIMRCALFLFAAFCLAACGGGGDDSTSPPAANVMKLSVYGQPWLKSQASVAHDQVASAPDGASAVSGTSADASTTVQTLQEALAARGVTADITPQVMNGTSLHALIMGENNGLPPTPDQFKADLNSWVIANFQLDDMVTPWHDPAQTAAVAQFEHDLEIFIERMHVAGKQVWIVVPIEGCDYPPGETSFRGTYTASDALARAIAQATVAAAALEAGGISYNYLTTQDPVTGSYTTVNTVTEGHMGADCRTPDAYLQNLQMQSIADTVAELYKEDAAKAGAASGASAASAPGM